VVTGTVVVVVVAPLEPDVVVVDFEPVVVVVVALATDVVVVGCVVVCNLVTLER